MVPLVVAADDPQAAIIGYTDLYVQEEVRAVGSDTLQVYAQSQQGSNFNATSSIAGPMTSISPRRFVPRPRSRARLR